MGLARAPLYAAHTGCVKIVYDAWHTLNHYRILPQRHSDPAGHRIVAAFLQSASQLCHNRGGCTPSGLAVRCVPVRACMKATMTSTSSAAPPHQLGEKESGDYGKIPSYQCCNGVLYSVFRLRELAAGWRYTTPS
jgi:hypothetical protein